MTYLLLCALVFCILSVIDEQKTVWLILTIVTSINYFLTLILDSDGTLLYVLVPIVTFAGAVALCKPRTTLGFYHAIILLSTLIAYAALAYDVSQGQRVLIYNNYEAVIYALVGCQLITVFEPLFSAYRDHTASRRTGLVNLQRNSRA